MKTKSLFPAVVTLIILVAQWSCQTDKEVQVNPVVNAPITIAEAKDWYNGASDKRARGASQTPGNRLAYWDAAQNTQLANGTPVVIVPLFYNYRLPVVLSKSTPLTKKEGKPAALSQSTEDLQISKKLIIAKDGQGGYRSCVMVIMPTEDNHKKNKKVKTETFEGSVLIYNESETDFLFGMQYDKGKLKKVFQANSAKNARAPQGDCYQAIYQANAPNQVGGSSGNRLRDLAEQADIPMSFFDNGGIFYSLVDFVSVDCGEGTPFGPPFSDPSNPNEANWILPNRSGGGVPGSGGSGGSGGGPVPIDEGQPINLGPTDLWLWDMRNRSAGPIYFNEEESNLIRTYPDLTYSLGNYVQQFGQKPTISHLALDINSATDEQIKQAINNMFPGGGEIKSGELELLGIGTDAYHDNLKKYYQDGQIAVLLAILHYGYYEAQKKEQE